MSRPSSRSTLYRLIEAGQLAHRALLLPLSERGLEPGDDAILFELGRAGTTEIELAADMIFVTPTGTQDSSAGFGQQPTAAPQGNTWGTPAPTGQAGGSADEQPPF